MQVYIEMIPRPYGDIDIVATTDNIFTLFDYIRKDFPSIKAMYTGVRGPDSFFQVECNDINVLKDHISLHQLVTGIEKTPITIPAPVNTIHEPGLRVSLVVPQMRKRRR